MRNCDHPESDMHDIQSGGNRLLRVCRTCMQELHTEYERLSKMGLSLDQINRIIPQPRTSPEWIDSSASALALVGNFARKPEGVGARRDRSGRNRLTLSADDRNFLRAVGIEHT